MFKSGNFVSDYVVQQDGSRVPEKQIQPHGVELTVDRVWRMSDYCVLGDDEYTKAGRVEATLVDEGTYVDKSSVFNHSNNALEEVDSDDGDEEGLDTSKKTEIEIDKPHYVLLEGPYVVRYNEKIAIPDDCIGFVWPRSRLIRNNNYLSSAVWDSGYEGRGEGGLHINTMTFLETGMRLGQMVMCRANVMEQYDGSHQGENINE